MIRCKKCGSTYLRDQRPGFNRWLRVGSNLCWGEVLSTQEARSILVIGEFEPVFPQDSVWEYEGTRYRVNAWLENNLTQYQNRWSPTVRYTLDPPNALVFYRADVEFNAKFKRVDEDQGR